MINETNFVFIVKNSFPTNESFLKSIAKQIFQLRFIVIWIFLKTIRWLRPNNNKDYLKDREYIEWANKVCKKTISDDLHDSYLSYVEGVKGGSQVLNKVISPEWWKGEYILEVGSGLGQCSHQIAKWVRRRSWGLSILMKK